MTNVPNIKFYVLIGHKIFSCVCVYTKVHKKYAYSLVHSLMPITGPLNGTGINIKNSQYIKSDNQLSEPIENVCATLGNLKITTNTISSTNENGHICLYPNGVGEVLLKADPLSTAGAATKRYVDTYVGQLKNKCSYSLNESTSSSGYVTLSSVIYVKNAVPLSSCKVVSSATGTYSLRLYDKTHSKTICEKTSLSNTDDQLISFSNEMSSSTGLPKDDAILCLQGKVSTGTLSVSAMFIQ